MKLNKYKDIEISEIEQLSGSKYALLGHGTRFGKDIVLVEFDESSVLKNQFDCN